MPGGIKNAKYWTGLAHQGACQGQSGVKPKTQALVGRGAAGASAASRATAYLQPSYRRSLESSFDKLFPALAVRTCLSSGEVHLHELLKKKSPKPNLDSHPDRSESLAKLVHPLYKMVTRTQSP